MSQAGIVDIEGSHPQIPTTFVCNVGSAVPIANTLEILGSAVAAHSIPLETVGSGNTVMIEVQYASAAASSIANNAGVASFNSADFTVDANGYVSASGAVALTFDGDTGSATPSGGVIHFNANVISGSSPNFQASGSTVQLFLSDANSNLMLGYHAGNGSISGGGNTVLGVVSGVALTSGAFNVAIGYATFGSMQTGSGNVAIGQGSMGLATGSTNTAVGFDSLDALVGGSNNTVIGNGAGSGYTGSESSNVCISNGGTAAESNVIRIGTQGSGAGQQNKCFVAGIAGVTGTSSAVVAGLNTSTGQLLQTTVTAGTGISVTPAAGTITIAATGTTTLTYTAVAHGASPYTVLSTDDYLGVDSTLGVVSILLPNAPSAGRVFIVKDSKAQAVANNITVTTVGGAVTIDGATTYVMATNYQSNQFIFNGTSYEVF